MEIYFSAVTGGFYSKEIHGDAIPDGAVHISESEYFELLDQQSAGLTIVADKHGYPTLQTPSPVVVDPAVLRAAAYRDESDPLFFKAQRGEGTMDEWLAKIAEIKERYPMEVAA